MNLKTALVALPAALLFTGCSSVDIPDPTPEDYAYQTTMISSHPGMDCVMEWVGQYVTNCYPMTVHPPYSVRVYFPHGCTCPPVQPRPNNYVAPRPVVINKTTNVTVNKNSNTTVNKNTTVTPPKPAPKDAIPPGYKTTTIRTK
jgi:hypothetical protein